MGAQQQQSVLGWGLIRRRQGWHFEREQAWFKLLGRNKTCLK